MTYYTTLGHNLKRGIWGFCKKLSKEFYRPTQKFITDMIYGLLPGQSCYLTEIARKLKENIALNKTVERLSRNLMNFDNAKEEREKHYRKESIACERHATFITCLCNFGAWRFA